MSTAEVRAVVEYLDAIDTTDFEAAHAWADDALLKFVPVEVAAAYDRLVFRTRKWASA